MNVVKPITIRELFDLISKYPSKGSRGLKTMLQTGKMGRTTIDKYRNIAQKLGLTALNIAAMSDAEISKDFGLSNKPSSFKQPNWPEVVNYLLCPRLWGARMNTEQNAWRFLYVQKYWPDYDFIGPLPEDCMSERTFNRYYLEYLTEHNLAFIKHHPNSGLNFGPASMMEIDAIGDKFKYVDSNSGEVKTAVIFTAVSKFSGKVFARFMPSSEGHCWSQSIIEACWFYGGLFQVVRTDNDSAICIHGRGNHRGNQLRPSVRILLKELQLTADLCPPRAPRWKGLVENTNGLLERQLFSDPTKYQLPLHAADLDELNKMLMQEVDRINFLPRSGSRLSRQAIFETYEKPYMRALPLMKPSVRWLSCGSVRQDGWAAYLKNYYYAGLKYAGCQILIENQMGQNIRILREDNFKEIASYELDHNRLPPPHYHKAPQFLNEKDEVQQRQKSWFVEQFGSLDEPPEHVLKLIEVIWNNLSQAHSVATRHCNYMWDLYEKHPGDLDALDAACAFILDNKDYSDFKHILKSSFLIMQRLKQQKGVEALQKQEEQVATGSSEAIADTYLHGADFYDQFNR